MKKRLTCAERQRRYRERRRQNKAKEEEYKRKARERYHRKKLLSRRTELKQEDIMKHFAMFVMGEKPQTLYPERMIDQDETNIDESNNF